jgi:precorrin-6Y C5,15-methyltransferase (decarboxylating)
MGSTLVDLLGAERVQVHPAVSSVALARARMRWSAESVEVVRLVDPGADLIRARLAPGRRLVVLSRDETSPTAVAEILAGAGFGSSRLTVFGDLGSSLESCVTAIAEQWPTDPVSRLNLVCVECVPTVESAAWSTAPGLPDDEYEHDGQLTKRDVRASAVAHLRPAPGQLLWDLGAGAGSVAIEWARFHPHCRAVAVERDPERASRIRRNANRLGALSVSVAEGPADVVTTELPPPDAVFLGGGLSSELVRYCWERLVGGGRLVAHAVTVETEMIMVAARRRLGGELTRISVERLDPIGDLHGWKPARAVVQWSITKPLRISTPSREDDLG